MAVVVIVTYFPSLRDAQGQRFRTSWQRLVERLRKVQVSRDKHDVPGISLASYRGDRRALANVEHVYAVGLDLDERIPSWTALAAGLQSVGCFVHTTWSSTPGDVRARVFIRLTRPVTADEYRRCYAFCANVIERGGVPVDRAASDPSRFWFLPSVPPGGEYQCSEGCGPELDVEAALAAVPPPAPPPTPEPIPRGHHLYGECGDIEERAAAYLAKCEPAISGSGGHNTTFIIAQRLVRGFALDEATAYRLMTTWNARCQPPWSERELRRKIRQAIERGTIAEGSMLERRR